MRYVPILVLTGAWLLAGCASETNDEAMKQNMLKDLKLGVDQWQQAEQQAQQQSELAASPSGVGAPIVQLIKPGAQPMRPLRYVFQPGDLGRHVVDVGVSTPNPGEKGPAEIVLPTMRFTLVLTGETLADGTYRINFQVTDVDVLARKGTLPQMVDHLKPSAEHARPFSGWVIVDDRGLARQVHAPIPPNAQKELKQAFDLLLALVHQLTPPLPAEPVGQGASWSAIRAIKTFELKTQEQMTYTLTGLTDNGGSLNTSATRTAKQQPWTAPSKTPANVVAYSYVGRGLCNFSFSTPLSGISLGTRSSRTLQFADGQPSDMVMNIELSTGTGQ